MEEDLTQILTNLTTEILELVNGKDEQGLALLPAERRKELSSLVDRIGKYVNSKPTLLTNPTDLEELEKLIVRGFRAAGFKSPEEMFEKFPVTLEYIDQLISNSRNIATEPTEQDDQQKVVEKVTTNMPQDQQLDIKVVENPVDISTSTPIKTKKQGYDITELLSKYPILNQIPDLSRANVRKRIVRAVKTYESLVKKGKVEPSDQALLDVYSNKVSKYKNTKYGIIGTIPSQYPLNTPELAPERQPANTPLEHMSNWERKLKYDPRFNLLTQQSTDDYSTMMNRYNHLFPEFRPEYKDIKDLLDEEKWKKLWEKNNDISNPKHPYHDQYAYDVVDGDAIWEDDIAHELENTPNTPQEPKLTIGGMSKITKQRNKEPVKSNVETTSQPPNKFEPIPSVTYTPEEAKQIIEKGEDMDKIAQIYRRYLDGDLQLDKELVDKYFPEQIQSQLGIVTVGDYVHSLYDAEYIRTLNMFVNNGDKRYYKTDPNDKNKYVLKADGERVAEALVLTRLMTNPELSKHEKRDIAGKLEQCMGRSNWKRFFPAKEGYNNAVTALNNFYESIGSEKRLSHIRYVKGDDHYNDMYRKSYKYKKLSVNVGPMPVKNKLVDNDDIPLNPGMSKLAIELSKLLY